LAFATFLVWRLWTGACGVGACGVGACGFWRYRMPPKRTRVQRKKQEVLQGAILARDTLSMHRPRKRSSFKTGPSSAMVFPVRGSEVARSGPDNSVFWVKNCWNGLKTIL